MLRRTYLGLEICSNELRAVAVQRQGKSILWRGGQTSPLADGILRPNPKKINVNKPELFVIAAKELLDPIAKKETRIAAVLPDNCGQLFLLNLETPLKSRAEGAEIIRWRLKDLLPDDFGAVALDYQVLEENEGGQKKVLAAVISKEVLLQYEYLLERSGYAASVVDFHTLALYNSYRTQFDLGRDFILLGVDGCQLSIMVFANRVLEFCRLRQIESQPERVFNELNRSLVEYRNQHSGFNRLPVHLHSDWQQGVELFAAVNSVFDQEVQWLVSPLGRVINYPQDDISAVKNIGTNGLVASLGGAERMIKRVSA